MLEHIKNAQWIWCNHDPKQDEYGEFVDAFSYESGNVTLQISADSNYATYINGALAAWGQYADFPYDKVYDKVDVTSFCRKGTNRIATIVWYYGLESSSVYYPGKAGVLYTLVCNHQVLCQSSAATLSRMSQTYQNHRCKILSGQLGFGYGYHATKEDNWLIGELHGFTPSVIVDQALPLRIRPCDKLTLLPEVVGIPCKRLSETDIIFDLGREQVGFLSFELSSSCEQNITISYGEHLADGRVRRIIGDRDFSIEYRAKVGNNAFLNPFRRFGCRYLEISSEYSLGIQKIAIVPTMYVLTEKKRPKLTALQNKIYDMCVETLHLCIHEHYEDCPWREQALYAMDSRNQMLCGYYAFGEHRFPRSNLELISKDHREDGLLSICYPIKLDLVIPSFSLHYITACREYLEHSKDTAFIAGIYPKLQSIIGAFTDRIENGLFQPFEGKSYWNFYEWTENLDNWGLTKFSSDLLSNALLSLALQNMAVIAKELCIENDYPAQAELLNIRIKESFWDKEKGICYNYVDHISYSQLGNAVAILCEAVTGADAEALCEKLLSDPQMTQISLSMCCFLYDALLKTNKEKYTSVVLDNIEKTYAPMLDAGSTTVWETELGEQDFSGAGSLCHGWSSMPVYYYHTLQA
mgnify:CR=1 FL=1